MYQLNGFNTASKINGMLTEDSTMTKWASMVRLGMLELC